jgi:hypothetical protein
MSLYQSSQSSGSVSFSRRSGEWETQYKIKIWPKNLLSYASQLSCCHQHYLDESWACPCRGREGNEANSLGAEGESNGHTTHHSTTETSGNWPVHRIFEPASDLLKIMFRERLGPTERFVEVRTTYMEFGNSVSSSKHGVRYCCCGRCYGI